MTRDPFSDTPADEPQAEQVSPWDDSTTDNKKERKTVTVGSEGKVVLTFKGGSGFEAPWVVVHATDVDDALETISGDNAEKFKRLVDETAKVGKYFSGTGTGGGRSSGGQARQGGNSGGQLGKPAGATEAPNGEKRFCKHGEMDWVSKISKKTNKPYSGWFCPSKDRNDECDPQWPNKG